MQLTAQEVLGAYQLGILTMEEARILLGVGQEKEKE
jgi:hypothetical protein